jgi:hypothetical protein
MDVGAHSSTFTITNNCPFTIWPATLTGGGGSQLTTTGLELASKASTTLDISPQWTGSIRIRYFKFFYFYKVVWL